MKTFPLFLDVSDREILLIGGGEQAAQKARLILKTEARLVVHADRPNDELMRHVAEGRARLNDRPLPAAMAAARLVFIATGCAGADAGHAAVARSLGRLINVVDRPELCDIVTPAIVDRDPVVVAIGTEGTAPVLARRLKTEIEQLLEPRLGAFAALAGGLRERVARRVAPARRRAFWEWAFTAPRRRFTAGDEAGAEAELERALEGGFADAPAKGRVALVGAGPGSADLITLRGLQRLQTADIIFHDRLVDPSVLELARRDAERVDVGKAPGAHSWPQERINAAIVEAAEKGLQVVRLKGGDPGIFARGSEEAEALDAAGIEWEIVAGVTAASAAAADTRTFLTERAEIQSLTLTTGRTAEGEPRPDWAALARRGGAVAFYMSVKAAPRIATELLASGAPPDLPVEIVERAGTPAMRHIRTTLSCLPRTMREAAVQNPAVLMLRWRRSASAVIPLAEHRRADAHDRGAEADCRFEIAAHPH